VCSMFGNDLPYVVPLGHLIPFEMSAYHESLPKISVENNSYKTKLKKETRKFFKLRSNGGYSSHQTSLRYLMKW